VTHQNSRSDYIDICKSTITIYPAIGVRTCKEKAVHVSKKRIYIS